MHHLNLFVKIGLFDELNSNSKCWRQPWKLLKLLYVEPRTKYISNFRKHVCWLSLMTLPHPSLLTKTFAINTIILVQRTINLIRVFIKKNLLKNWTTTCLSLRSFFYLLFLCFLFQIAKVIFVNIFRENKPKFTSKMSFHMRLLKWSHTFGKKKSIFELAEE